MTLADLMKKGFLTSATATPATVATLDTSNRATVASAATVAVANHQKYKSTVASVATVAVATIQNSKPALIQPPANDCMDSRTDSLAKHDQSLIADRLALFRFDLVQENIDSGYAASELQRVNNMAYEFMQAQGMGFDDAIKAAAKIVVDSQIAAHEAAYTDVMALFNRMTR